MAAVTWKNIAPQNTSGILNSMNNSAAALANAGKGIGDAVSGYVDDRQTRETDAFVTDLMNAGSQEERDAMISAANQSWLNLDQVNKTNYELGAPDRERKAFEEQLAAEQISAFDTLAEENRLKKDYWDHQVLNPKPTATGSGKSSNNSSKSNTFDPKDNDPFKKDGGVFPNLDDSWHGGGSGLGPEDIDNYRQSTQNFLSKAYDSNLIDKIDSGKGDGTTRREVTAWHINELAKKGLLTFDDRISLPWAKDRFKFKYGNDTYSFSQNMNEEASDAFYELIMEEVIGKPSRTKVVKRQYFDEFTKNNPDRNNEEGYKLFEDIYNANIKNKKSFDENGQAALYFGALPSDKEEITKLTSTKSDKNELVWDGDKYVENPKNTEIKPERSELDEALNTAASNVGGPMANEIIGMSRSELQTLYNTLNTRQKNLQEIGQVLKGDELDLFNAVTKALGS